MIIEVVLIICLQRCSDLGSRSERAFQLQPSRADVVVSHSLLADAETPEENGGDVSQYRLPTRFRLGYGMSLTFGANALRSDPLI